MRFAARRCDIAETHIFRDLNAFCDLGWEFTDAARLRVPTDRISTSSANRSLGADKLKRWGTQAYAAIGLDGHHDPGADESATVWRPAPSRGETPPYKTDISVSFRGTAGVLIQGGTRRL